MGPRKRLGDNRANFRYKKGVKSVFFSYRSHHTGCSILRPVCARPVCIPVSLSPYRLHTPATGMVRDRYSRSGWSPSPACVFLKNGNFKFPYEEDAFLGRPPSINREGDTPGTSFKPIPFGEGVEEVQGGRRCPGRSRQLTTITGECSVFLLL